MLALLAVAVVTNPYFPLAPGTRWEYRGVEGGVAARDVVTVSKRTETVGGAECAVVQDLLYRDGRLAERTVDFYSQDEAGNVWYYGEDTAELDSRGRVKSTEGSWRAGRDGAKPGIFMPARPRRGQTFKQEDYPGHAEDRFSVMSAGDRALKTKEWTPLEPGVRDRKWYVRGIGLIAEATVKGGSDRLELHSFRTA
jgi:hypothetical protein